MIFTDWFSPAYRAGGPIVSVSNLVDCIHNLFSVRIFTSNSDLKTIISVPLNKWVQKEKYQVLYSDISCFNVLLILNNKEEINKSVLYLNSIFSLNFTIIPLLLIRLGFIRPKKVIVAPRGMLQQGAMNLKTTKKKIFLILSRYFGLYKNCYFHSTDEVEKEDIANHLNISHDKIQIVSNIPRIFNQAILRHKKSKDLKMVFVARLSKKKNLEGVLNYLLDLDDTCNIKLDIYGPQEDDYFNNLIIPVNNLGKNIIVNYCGELKPHELENALKNYHVYILPTLGENFGHSIFEALSAGLPIIISDQTPWRNLKDQKVGFDIPLIDKNSFTKAIEKFATMSQDEYLYWSKNAREYAHHFYHSQNYVNGYKSLFTSELNVGVVAPIPFERYKGGISNFAESLMHYAPEFKKDKIHFNLINTCVISRTNESTGRFKFINLKNYLLFIVRAYRQIKRENIKVLHIHTSVGRSILKDSISAILFKWILGTKNILHLHVGEVSQVEIKGVLNKIYEWVLSKAYNTVLVLSPQLKVFFESIFKDRVHIISNFYNSNSLGGEIKEINKIIKITFIGSISQSKGILDLLEALSDMKEKNWQLSIAGEFINNDFKNIVMESQVYNSVKDNVKFLGYAFEDYKVSLLKNNDILVLPSYAEGMPISLLEAISYGNAIVTTDVGANHTHFSSICNLLKPGDIKGLKMELSKLINDKELLKKRKKQAQELSQRFTFDAFKKQITPIYKTI